ncbi:hypothetical protein PLCT2_01697 [Planctomycetaceae bacterium]|nr:hypothetical protein PLCT2_01697 [Planctomycetaceae bacterium]
MTEEKPEISKLSDEQIDRMLKGDRPAKPDPDAPSARLPEALYYYILTVLEAAILIGIWGYMLRGAKAAVAKAPPESAPAFDQIWWHVKFGVVSTLQGLSDQMIDRPWLLAGVMLGALAIFVPRTQRTRKRVVYLVSGIIVTSLAVLLVVQFTTEFGLANNRAIY